jgi:hypothetical protein
MSCAPKLWMCVCVCLSPVRVCPGRQLWSGPGEWTPEALSTNSRFGIRGWHSRGIGTQIFEDENMSLEWALKFSTLKIWVGLCPTQIFKFENLNAYSHLRFPSSTIYVPVPREFQTRIPNREFVLSASGVHSQGPDQSCRLGHTHSQVHRTGGQN